MTVPTALEWWRGEPGGSEWLDRLPALVAECAELWSLRVGEPYSGGNVAWVAPAELPDGTPAVLKVNFPERESEHEAEALAFWAGEGAVRLLAEDEGRRALLNAPSAPRTGTLLQSSIDEMMRMGRLRSGACAFSSPAAAASSAATSSSASCPSGTRSSCSTS